MAKIRQRLGRRLKELLLSEEERKRRLEGLLDEPRPGAPHKITDEEVREVVTRTLESTQRAQTHESRRQWPRTPVSPRESVGRIWRAFGLKPHLVETFKLSPDPPFIEKVRDIAGLICRKVRDAGSRAHLAAASTAPWAAGASDA